jgi:serine protease AprX
MARRRQIVDKLLKIQNLPGVTIIRSGRAVAARLLVVLAFLSIVSSANAAGIAPLFPKLDASLANSASVASSIQTTRVIVTLKPGVDLPAAYKKYAHGNKLTSINAQVLDLPNNLLGSVSNLAGVSHVHNETVVYSTDFRTNITSGAFFARQDLGFSGGGVGVAFVDSGVSSNTDLTIAGALDFTSTGTQDDAGHGTHVAGIIAGSGAASGGQQAGVAPGAALWSLKALGLNGSGKLTDVLAALDWLTTNAVANHIRVVNLSFGTPVLESYLTDPLTLATQALVQQGVVVVAAAGNDGTDSQGHTVWGGITSPGNAPWVITVGASSTMGTLTRADDTLANFSSRGPTAVDRGAKPDIVASGVGTISTAAFGSAEYQSCAVAVPTCLIGGTRHTAAPYMALSGTSMATPVVSGTVALMLQANPALTPNLVKAILEYTAQVYPAYAALAEGAGFLNSLGAIRLAKFYATAKKGSLVPVEPIWGKQIIWGNHRIAGGIMVPSASAWADNIVWGTATDGSGDNIVWGTACGAGDCGDNIVWGTARGDNIVWGTLSGDNIVWGTDAGDNIVWGTSDAGDNIVWGTDDGDNIVWGTACGGGDCGDNIVWGTDDGDNIVWGTDDGDNIVWGTSDGDNIVWGTALVGDNIVWGTADDGDNIVWGTDAGDNIVWGTDDGDNIVWGTAIRRPRALPRVINPSYIWFLNAKHDASWMRQEFGDTFVSSTAGRK